MATSNQDKKLCDICHQRPATVQVTVRENGRRTTLNVCQQDYAKLRSQEKESPFGSLFGGSFGGLGDDFFDRFFEPSRSSVPRRQPEVINIDEYLSEQAKEVLQAAAQQAVESGVRNIDSEHLLSALADNEVAQAILKQFKVSPEELKRQLEEIAPKPNKTQEKREEGQIGVSPRVKSALEAAFNVSRELGHSYIGPEHLLIGLAEEESLASDVFRRYGLTPQALRQQTIRVVGRGAEEGRVEPKSDTPNLDKYSRDITQMARQGKLDPVIGRADEIETVIEILARRKKNNPVLIGEPGVGKTAIVEGLAQRIISGEVPEVLHNKRLVELNVTSMVAGTKYRGEFEERVKQVLDEILERQNEILLFIDELHTIVGAGSAEGGLDIANTFKPMLARGELHLIGATTLNEYQKHIEKDAALERRFQPVLVPEPTVDQTIMILRGLRDRFEAHHKVTITEGAIVAAAEFSDRYITGRFLPDKAIDLIDQAAARVHIRGTTRPPALQQIEAELAQLRRERDSATSRKDYDRAREIEGQIEAKDKDREKQHDEWQKSIRSGTPEVTADDVAEIVSKLTGVPVTELTVEERQRLIKMEERLHERVIGQDKAVTAVSEAVRLARAGLKDRRRPIATFFFLGPTGVGKTELAKALAEVVFGSEESLIRIDMSEYMERHTVSRLVGAPPGYVGYEEGGQLTEAVRRRPYSVLLLDELEKAHQDVQNILLQVFDDGRLTDGKGRVVDFTNTIIIATSNVGSEIIQQNLEMPEKERRSYQKLKEDLLALLRRQFRPEFLNRIDEIIVFHSLTREQIAQIVGLQLLKVQRTAHGQGITLEWDDSLIKHLADVGYQPEFGARQLRRLIRSEVEIPLSSAMLRAEVQEGDTVRFRYDAKTGKVLWDKIQPTEKTTPVPERKRKPRVAA
ncbi:MAG: AAA family ATPase [Candidatus Korobacteraceae bacterium]